MKITIEGEDIQVVLDALAERPLKLAYNTFTRVMGQVREQTPAATEEPQS